MTKFKSILIGLILLAVTLLMAALAWLWQHNNKTINPLPIPTSKQELANPVADETNDSVLGDMVNSGIDSDNKVKDADMNTAHSQVSVCADDVLRAPLNTAVVNFERRYANLNVKVVYLPRHQMLEPKPLITGCDIDHQDIVLFSQSIPTALLESIKDATNQAENPASSPPAITADAVATDQQKPSETLANVRLFNYALKDKQRLEGALLSDKTAAISLRNYLLSSLGQDIFGRYGFDNIDGYNNQVDDLFNPKGNPPADTPDELIEKTLD